ncbi:MAG: zinc finger Ran-binding domain-containing protein, partial [Candidatus Bathyarchaeota archaeon]|nr:zinc finger Ran-binding domain-containing protein [Candidatus Bathyarchaeota archaeon]
LLEGEEVRLQYVCFRKVMSPPSAIRKLLVDDGSPQMESKKGLLVFTNDNMIFMQQEGSYSSNYAQALRIPLEQISGVVSGGTFIPHIRILVGIGGASEQLEFVTFQSVKKPIHAVRADIEKLLRKIRQEKKRIAQEALAKGTVPAMIFCKFCGTRNKSDRSHCANCRAPLE